MITCQTFCATLQPGTDDPAVLEHLRGCDTCLDLAMERDPDLFFRAMGSQELVPPGGVDAFVEGVMTQVRGRQTETAAQPQRIGSVWQRLAVAATLAAGITGAALVAQHDRAVSSLAIAAHPRPFQRTAQPVALVTKPIIESYDSQNYTIVEVPSDASSDTKVVMIFDDQLPADL